MTLDAYITLAVIIFSFGGFLFTRYAPDMILMGAISVLLLVGVLSAEEMLSGFANEGMVTVAVLYIVASGLQETGAINWLSSSLIGRPKSIRTAQLKIMAPVSLISAFLNNTPVVAIFIPIVGSLAKNYRFPVSQLMIPLSYAAIAGGACTLIGSSTNLILNSMLLNHNVTLGLGMFDLAWIGIPCVLATMTFTYFFAGRLLPKHGSAGQELQDLREYTVEMLVAVNSVIDGKTIDQAGLRNLSGMYLVSIERDGERITSVGPDRKLRGGDRLMFVGEVESVVDLNKIRGLELVDEGDRHFLYQNMQRTLVEVAVSESCPLIGKSIKNSRFRTHYNAAIVAVARNGSHLRQKIGDIVLQPGDTLLVDARKNFLEQQRYSKDFLVTNQIKDSRAIRHHLSLVALGILALLVLCVSTQLLSMLQASLISAALMLIFRCTTESVSRKSIDFQVLVVIAASIVLGSAVEKSGLATLAAQQLLAISHDNAYFSLGILFLLAAVFTAILSNAAAAVMLFPIAIQIAESLHLSVMPFVITLMIGATASFATPISYQTNLMVFGPGGYQFSDYLRMGIPLTLLIGLITILIVPQVWTFTP